jgi:hypothetical protein
LHNPEDWFILTNIIGLITNNIGNKARGEAAMLKPLLGSENTERVLIFLLARKEGYPTEIARFYRTDVFGIQKQLDRLANGGVLVSRLAGRTRLYTFNPRYPFLRELTALIEKAFSFYPVGEREALLMNRRRPRRREKPL